MSAPPASARTQPLAPMMSSASVEHLTPPDVIARVQATLGRIDLDPCADAARSVPARTHYTAEDDGLADGRPWRGRVFMNPPYGRDVARWVGRFHQAWESDEMSGGIALLAARTDTRWFQALWAFTLCFVRGRLRFGDAPASAPFPSVVVYAGPMGEAFARRFASLGHVVHPR